VSTKTFIPGKQAALEDSIAKMETLLGQLGFEINAQNVLNPVENIYSQHIYDTRCRGLFTNGKGACDKACYASALGEFLERLSTNYFFSDFYLTPKHEQHSEDWLYYPNEKSIPAGKLDQLLTPELWQFYEQALEEYEDGFEFADFLSLNDHFDRVTALEMHSVKTGDRAFFPMNLLSNLYASNGLSAGNTALEAKIQGLSEIFERWVKNKIFQENLCLPNVPQTLLEQFPSITASIKALQQTGLDVQVRDASLGGKYPVINVTLIDIKKGRCFASFGAHPIFEVAIERTLTESLQGRHLQNLDGFQTPVHDEEMVSEAENLENHFIDSSGLIHSRFLSQSSDFEFQPWSFAEDMAEQWQQLCKLDWEQGTDVWLAQYPQFGFQAIRIIVPGMSEVYPLSEIVENNQNNGRALREALFAFDQYPDHSLPAGEFSIALEEILDVVEQIGASDHQGVANFIGLMPEPNSFWAQMNVAQLRFWCYVGLKSWALAFEQAQDMIFYLREESEWTTWVKAYMYLYELLDTQQASIETIQNGGDCDLSSFVAMFDSKTYESVLAVVKGESLFAGQDLGRKMFLNSKPHNRLVDIYESLRKAKIEEFSE